VLSRNISFWTISIYPVSRRFMPSLTSLLPQIAPTLGLTPGSLYERQRSLVRMKLLPAPQGRGRGSGAEATPNHLALLIIAVLATDNWSDTDERIRKLAAASYSDKRKNLCPITGQRTFMEALASIIEADEIDPLTDIRVFRTTLGASILQSNRKRWSDFGTTYARNPLGIIQVEAHLPSRGLHRIRHHFLNHKDTGK
jgi:hypothetical protein